MLSEPSLSWTINRVFCLQTGFEAFLDDLYYPFAFFLKFILIFQVTYLLHWVISKPGSCRKLPSGIVNSKRPGFVLAWFFKPYRKWWSWKAFQTNVNCHSTCKQSAFSWIPKPSEVRPFMCIYSSNSHERPHHIFILHNLWKWGQVRGTELAREFFQVFLDHLTEWTFWPP